jgi:hypothetical protein
MRACLETQKLEQLEARMDEIADRVARDRTNAARERTSTHEAQSKSTYSAARWNSIEGNGLENYD